MGTKHSSGYYRVLLGSVWHIAYYYSGSGYWQIQRENFLKTKKLSFFEAAPSNLLQKDVPHNNPNLPAFVLHPSFFSEGRTRKVGSREFR